ncbi:endolytic transglycosylase MltG [Salidesulfovibrio brasiliensis]|uniref:endolytic transglycosylase MltG n=1 Tax=Salidesulfovibrio brasiliensis TaxID=221711 RepID=UPI0006CF9F02|nr:endolytic transglycosylase MltG [Salidesulfovibrio brasiliensis]
MARKRILILLLLAASVAALGASAYFWRMAWLDQQFRTVPPESPGREIVFTVEKGSTFFKVARELKTENLITDVNRFWALARETDSATKVRAGKFLLNTGWTPDRTLTVLTTTPGIMIKVSVREGLTWWQTAEVVAESGICTEEEFAEAVQDPELLAEFGIQSETAEGFLFPETYLLTPPESDKGRYMVRTMLRQFFEESEAVWPEGRPEWKDLNRAVVLASLVEKETGDVTERERIAGVFANRLKRRMLIQADPTIIYGLGPAFDGNIRKKHLTDGDNPYNTYVHPGLPPGPICSPGLDSIEAAVRPEEHRFFYFVAKGDGSHYFSKSLKEHNRAVHKYQLRRNRATYRSTKQ